MRYEWNGLDWLLVRGRFILPGGRFGRVRSLGFTLVEVMATVVIMAIMLGGVLLAINRTTETVMGQALKERALAVAQRQMELLLASRQEPETADMMGEDELDPLFVWRMDLRRITLGGESPKPDLSNTVIEAKIEVEDDDMLGERSTKVELVRYFSQLKPIPGHAIAVPLSQVVEEPLWYLELRAKLGRDPTPDEVIAELIRAGELDMPAVQEESDENVEEVEEE